MRSYKFGNLDDWCRNTETFLTPLKAWAGVSSDEDDALYIYEDNQLIMALDMSPIWEQWKEYYETHDMTNASSTAMVYQGFGQFLQDYCDMALDNENSQKKPIHAI